MATGSKGLDQVNIIKGKREKLYGATLFTVFVILALLVGAIRPSIATIVKLRREIQVRESQNSVLSDKITSLSNLAQDYQQTEDQFTNLRLVYPSTGDFSYLMANVEALTVKHNLELRAIGFSNVANPQFTYAVLHEHLTTISVIGAQESIVPFLKDLEAMPMYGTVDQVSFDASPEGDGRLQFSVTLIIYGIDNPVFYE